MGTGKSTVAKLLRERGFEVVDADELAREAVKKNSPGLQSVVQAFGPDLKTKDGELDRAALAKLVFASKENLAKLEGIVHPLVRRLAEEKRRELEAGGAALAFYDVPLLFEKKMETMFDFIVVVASSEARQLERLRARNGWSEDEIRRRLSAQAALAGKIKKAHFVVQNDGAPAELTAQIDQLLKKLSPL
jgi:dephospho-CoA kinase